MLQTLWKKSSERVAKKLSRREHYCCGERLRVSCGGVAFFSVPTAANIPCFSLYPCRFAAWLPLRICCGCKKKTDCSSCRPAKKKAGPRPYFFLSVPQVLRPCLYRGSSRVKCNYPRPRCAGWKSCTRGNNKQSPQQPRRMHVGAPPPLISPQKWAHIVLQSV